MAVEEHGARTDVLGPGICAVGVAVTGGPCAAEIPERSRYCLVCAPEQERHRAIEIHFVTGTIRFASSPE
jgi:hypothetical protein